MSLDDDMVKLVAYTIVSLKRNKERVMPRGAGTIVVTERMTGEAFSSWIIARYLQSSDYRTLSEEEKLSRGEERYLRVDYVVSRRWQRLPSTFEEDQLATLEGVRDAISG